MYFQSRAYSSQTVKYLVPILVALFLSLNACGGGGGGGGKKKDTTPPTVSIVAPLADAVVGGTVEVSVTASDNVAVTEVVLSLDGVQFASLANAPYQTNLNTTLYADGVHVLRAEAYDGAKNSTAAQVSLTIKNQTGDTTAPTATVSPLSGAQIFGPDSIVITFSEAMESATLVLGGGMANEDDGGVWDGANQVLTVSPERFWSAGGARNLTVAAKDKAGNSLAPLSLQYHVIAYQLNARGGDAGSNGGRGGDGGAVTIKKLGGHDNQGRADIGLFNSSSLSVVPLPDAPAYDTGAHPLLVSGVTPIHANALNTGDTEPPAGEPYLQVGSYRLYISNGNGILFETSETATGIEIDSGATLIVHANNGNTASIQLNNDVVNAGDLRTASGNTVQRDSLALFATNYFGLADARIVTSGSKAGQAAGDIELSVEGSLYNQGAISANAFDSTAAQRLDGGNILLDVLFVLMNSGKIAATGEDSLTERGGGGGSITLQTYDGDIYNSGEIVVRGGDGVVQAGAAGSITLLAGFASDQGAVGAGSIYNSGRLVLRAGNASDGPVDATVGKLKMVVWGGNLRNEAEIYAVGGSTQSAIESGSDGVTVNMTVFPAIRSGGVANAGNLILSGDINTAGGNSAATGSNNGGKGGDITLILDASGSHYQSLTGFTDLNNSDPGSNRIALYGYTEIYAYGGSGNNGGDGAPILIQLDGESWDSGGGVFVDSVSGHVVNEADLSSRGGDVVSVPVSTPAVGGKAANISIQGDLDAVAVDVDIERLVNRGRLVSRGGDGRGFDAVGMNAGTINLNAWGDVVNRSRLTVNGGNDLSTADVAHGQSAGTINIFSKAGAIDNSGGIRASGGNGRFRGGDGGITTHQAPNITVSSQFIAHGGDADPQLAGSVGGKGGRFTFETPDISNLTLDATIDVTGGTGETAGADGEVITP